MPNLTKSSMIFINCLLLYLLLDFLDIFDSIPEIPLPNQQPTSEQQVWTGDSANCKGGDPFSQRRGPLSQRRFCCCVPWEVQIIGTLFHAQYNLNSIVFTKKIKNKSHISMRFLSLET